MMKRMQRLVDALCADACAGRATGTPGGARARGIVMQALRGAGLDPGEHRIVGSAGVNVIATLEGDTDRCVLVAAHYDHLGSYAGSVYRGADDNAAAVSILVEVARALVERRMQGRSVVIAAFDAEEPPHFMSDSMGSQAFVKHPTVPLDRIDQMICMDLVGHAVGPVEAPRAVRDSLFVLGAERSRGTASLVDAIEKPGVVARRVDAQVIPPLSDYLAFWQAKIPFVFLSCGRWPHYHTPADTPDKLDYEKIVATAGWLEELVRQSCARDDDGRFIDEPDDACTLRSMMALCEEMAEVSSDAALGMNLATQLLAICDAQGRLPDARRAEAHALVAMLETRFA